jgi:hypothetical protein
VSSSPHPAEIKAETTTNNPIPDLSKHISTIIILYIGIRRQYFAAFYSEFWRIRPERFKNGGGTAALDEALRPDRAIRSNSSARRRRACGISASIPCARALSGAALRDAPFIAREKGAGTAKPADIGFIAKENTNFTSILAYRIFRGQNQNSIISNRVKYGAQAQKL